MLVLCVLLPFYCVPYTINFSWSLAHSLSPRLSLILLVTLAAFDKRNFIWNSSKRICDFFNEAKQQLLQQIYKQTRNVRAEATLDGGHPTVALNGNRMFYFFSFFSAHFCCYLYVILRHPSPPYHPPKILGDKLPCFGVRALCLRPSLSLSLSLSLLACVSNIYCWKLNFNYSCMCW